MQIISSYGVELRKQNIPIRQTLEIYRSAVSYLIGIYVQVWEELREIRREQGQKLPEADRENIRIPVRVKKKDKEAVL